jgi:hypothetical protein
MTKCLNRETMQAFIDGELHESSANSAQLHLESCARCAGELENIRETNLRTRNLLDSLVTDQIPEVMPASVIQFAPESAASRKQVIAATIAGIAACALLVFLFLRHNAPPANSSLAIPKSANSSTPANAASTRQQVASLAPPQEISKSPSVRMPAHSPHTAHKPPIRPASSGPLEFIPLDDDGPIESGTIVRVNLNVSSQKDAHRTRVTGQVPVDVLVDEQGQVRAIRFLDGGAK